MDELTEKCYEQAAREHAEKQLNNGMYAKAYSDAKGDEKVAGAIYIGMRAEQLEKQYKQEEKDAREKEKQKRSQRTSSIIGWVVVVCFLLLLVVGVPLGLSHYVETKKAEEAATAKFMKELETRQQLRDSGLLKEQPFGYQPPQKSEWEKNKEKWEREARIHEELRKIEAEDLQRRLNEAQLRELERRSLFPQNTQSTPPLYVAPLQPFQVHPDGITP
jgi:hypothetical protein